MKKILFLAAAAIALASCSVPKMAVPTAVSTIGTASFADMKLERNQYSILTTVTAEASVAYTPKLNIIEGVDEAFFIGYSSSRKYGLELNYSGVLNFGYLNNDYDSREFSTNNSVVVYSPEFVARRLAIYRAINEARSQGADGFIEPTIATSIEQQGNRIIYKTTVTGKAIKLKTDAEL